MIDRDPTSLSAGGWLEDTSLVEKYTISEDAYNKREGLFKIVHDIYLLQAGCMYLVLKFLPLQSVNSLLHFFNTLIMSNTVGHTIGLISTLKILGIILWVHAHCLPTPMVFMLWLTIFYCIENSVHWKGFQPRVSRWVYHGGHDSCNYGCTRLSCMMVYIVDHIKDTLEGCLK
jgi:hypothetical protein